ncbi:MAG: UDP-N-acetylmuramoyl-L-alanine--D-glutamate ligase, partial [Clostridia bacterium]|nr:UDP-N-acetylmuramoyl-L-alanine--D-glutamate ligase [Clostridia bacterium]
MYSQLSDFVNGKKVLILGYGREGKSTYSILKNMNCQIGIADKNDVKFDADVTFHTGVDYQKAIYDYDIVFKSPGIVIEDKSEMVLSKITSQTEQMIKKYKDNIVGITGTKGKSTTSTLAYHILKNTVGNCVLMGNIGIPAFDMLEEINKNSIIIYELSCHQLEYNPFSPHIAVLLNIFEEHLDHYGTFEMYAKAKKNIYNNQSADDILICNYDNLPEKAYNKGNLVSVSIDNNMADIYLNNNSIRYFDDIICFDDLKSNLIGRHNMFNIAVAYNICKHFKISLDDFKKHLKTYTPLSHRLEFAGEYNGIKYYDDSISTISETTIRALNSIKDV